MKRHLIMVAAVVLVAPLAACADGAAPVTQKPTVAPAPQGSPTIPVAPTTGAAPFHAIPADAVVVTGTATCQFTPGPENGAGTGWVVRCELSMSDPRVSGSERTTGFHFIVEIPDLGGIAWVSDEASLTNAEGAWRGTSQGTDGEFGSLGEYHYFGEGEYEGLEFHYYYADTSDGPTELHGWISGGA